MTVRVVHLVRDSRAVAHSWQRAKFRPEANQFRQYMPIFPPRTSAKIWIQDNTFNGGLRRTSTMGCSSATRTWPRTPTG